ncbi:hypothetical protein [Photobacterium carnosum]|uniref:hypothetical protein n=1 Tax=Photobacterium carnosum TaxID=2023717 RepID=UPI001E2B1A16|nr:hypothetical protein [Photobacterium carnosum]MCD9526533.1 hypothetical protein [Photobacterium carnosum]
MFGMVNPVHSAIFRKKPESNDSGFFSSVGNSNDSVVVQLINFLLGSLAAYHAEGRADVRNGKSRSLHIFRKKPESNDSGFFSSVGNSNDSEVVQLINFLLGSLAASHDYYLMENGRADALVVMLAMVNPVHFTFLERNLNLTIQVFFRL